MHDLLVPVCKDYCHSRDQNFQCTELAQLGAMKRQSTQCSAQCTALRTWGLKTPEMFLKPWPSGIGPFTEHPLRLLKQAMDPGSGQFNRAHRPSSKRIEVQHTYTVYTQEAIVLQLRGSVLSSSYVSFIRLYFIGVFRSQGQQFQIIVLGCLRSLL